MRGIRNRRAKGVLAHNYRLRWRLLYPRTLLSAGCLFLSSARGLRRAGFASATRRPHLLYLLRWPLATILLECISISSRPTNGVGCRRYAWAGMLFPASGLNACVTFAPFDWLLRNSPIAYAACICADVEETLSPTHHTILSAAAASHSPRELCHAYYLYWPYSAAVFVFMPFDMQARQAWRIAATRVNWRRAALGRADGWRQASGRTLILIPSSPRYRRCRVWTPLVMYAGAP